MDLTKRQQEIFDFIKRYSAKHRLPADRAGDRQSRRPASSSTVHAHLANLEKLGLLRRDPSKPRAIELLDRARGRRAGRGERALAGQARRPAAGRPGRRRRADPRRGEHRGVRRVPAVTGGEDGDYILRIRGESMKNAGILEGDYVVVRPQDDADRRRDRRRAGRRGGDGQALLPRDRPRPPAARERDDGAHPHQGRARPRQGRGALQERDMTATALQFDFFDAPAPPHPVRRLARSRVTASSRGGGRPRLTSTTSSSSVGSASARPRRGCRVRRADDAAGACGVLRSEPRSGRSAGGIPAGTIWVCRRNEVSASHALGRPSAYAPTPSRRASTASSWCRI